MQGGHIIMEDNQVAYKTFRDYTDCLYSSYGTKWNGNAAAYNGSLYIELKMEFNKSRERLHGKAY
jgi:hypothetical protein